MISEESIRRVRRLLLCDQGISDKEDGIMISEESVRRLLLCAQGISDQERTSFDQRITKASQDSGELQKVHSEILKRSGGATKGYQSKLQRKIDTR